MTELERQRLHYLVAMTYEPAAAESQWWMVGVAVVLVFGIISSLRK